ncbi:MAG: gamma carbonic anhydrase family protein [Nitriliruptor sp.]|uniref:gamma carbonic anhydrase family protein n=1 Tax=Nitriliruptor sp. TaxID=2448056 RepID=UPI0034A05AEE
MPTVLTVAGFTPELAGAYLADNATVAGNVQLASGVSIWFGTVLRAEHAPITVGADSNLQDNSVVHTDPTFACSIGERVTVGHRVVLHGCTVEDDVLIGMGAVVMNGAVIGEGAVVGAGAVVTEGTVVPPRTIAVGVPAKILEKDVPPVPRPNVAGYIHLADVYREATPAVP